MTIRLFSLRCQAGNLSVSGLRGSEKRVCKGQMQRLRPRISIGLFMQMSPFLPVLPQLYILVSEGCFYENGMFSVFSIVDTKALEQIFRHKVLKMLLVRGKITQDIITLIDERRHKGFNVFFWSRNLSRQENFMYPGTRAERPCACNSDPGSSFASLHNHQYQRRKLSAKRKTKNRSFWVDSKN